MNLWDRCANCGQFRWNHPADKEFVEPKPASKPIAWWERAFFAIYFAIIVFIFVSHDCASLAPIAVALGCVEMITDDPWWRFWER